MAARGPAAGGGPRLKVEYSHDGKEWLDARWYQAEAVTRAVALAADSGGEPVELEYDEGGFVFTLLSTQKPGVFKMIREDGSSAYLRTDLFAGVRAWCETKGLQSLVPVLQACGVQSVSDLPLLEDRDLAAAGVSLIDRKKFMKACGIASPAPAATTDSESATAARGTGFDAIVLERQIGVGSGGVVYSAVWRGVRVAAKEVAVVGDAELKAMEAECEVMKKLGNHPHVVSFLGVSTIVADGKPTRTLLLTEFMENGSLHQCLQSTRYSWSQLANMAMQVAAGLGHLHQNKIVHRDLAARNVLVDASNRVRISDFGISRRLESTDSGMTATKFGPIRWMAPECLKDDGSTYSFSSDMWAFGVLLLEMATGGQQPWREHSNPVVCAKILSGETAESELPPTTPAPWRDLVRACWDFKPAARPTAAAAHTALAEMQTVLHTYDSW